MLTKNTDIPRKEVAAPFFDLDPREWEVLRNHVPADVTVVSPLPVWVH